MDGIGRLIAGVMFVGFMLAFATLNLNLGKIIDALMLIADKLP